MTAKSSKGRRQFLKNMALTGAGLLTLPLANISKTFASSKQLLRMYGLSPNVAHHIRDTQAQKPTVFKQADIVIVGAGVSGLSAARHLYQNGVKDFIFLEAESRKGGNACWGENDLSAYPWGAHYLPILTKESDFLKPLLEEANAITGYDQNGRPFYNKDYLLSEPKERMLIHGQWQNGFVPDVGVPDEDKKQIQRFFEFMHTYMVKTDSDGRFVFSLPVAKSSQDKLYLSLDKMTMKQFLEQHQFNSAYLQWYVDYCCRDDYGAGIEHVSAWAGVHYFAARRQASANAGEDAILTWPQGNGFLVEQMAKPFKDKFYYNHLVHGITPTNEGVEIVGVNANDHQLFGVKAKQVILALPSYIIKKLLKPNVPSRYQQLKSNLNYSPWIVANVRLDTTMLRQDTPLAWDNISFDNRSVGYVHAKHQTKRNKRESVVTYYRPMDDMMPSLSRQYMVSRSTEQWQQYVLNDLESMHTGISEAINDIQLRLLGHAMIRPEPGVITQLLALQNNRSDGPFYYCHTDMSGVSLFEEAFWQGLQTAKVVIKDRAKLSLAV